MTPPAGGQNYRHSQREGNCICQSPAAFHRAKQPATEERAVPIGREHHGTEGGVKFYLSFTDEEVYRGVDLPKKEENCPMVPTTANIITTTDIPGATNVPEVQPVPKPMPEKKAPKYAGWEKVLHPSQPVLAAGEIPHPPTMPKWKGRALQLA